MRIAHFSFRHHMWTSVIKARRSRASRIRICDGTVFADEKGPDAKEIIALLIIYALTIATSFVGASRRSLPTITHRNTSRTRTGGGADAGRRILFVSCPPSWR